MSPEDWTAADHALDALQKTISSTVENDFREITDEYQPTLHHYTDVKGALGILQTGHLWFTERAHLNDPVEIQYGLEVAYQMFEKAAKNRGAKIPTEAASHLKGEHAFGLSTNGFWIFSFSLDDNNLSQWQNYADDGRGVCLGFSTDNLDMEELVKPVEPVASTWLRFPVSYNENHLRQQLQKYVDMGLDLLEKVNLPAHESYHQPLGHALLYERDVFRALNYAFYAHSILHKHPAYQYEQEYRLLVSGFRHMVARSDSHRLRERGGEIVGYLDLPIPAWEQHRALTHIRLGPAAPGQLDDQLRMALMALGIPTVAAKIDKSDIPYRSTR